MAARAVSCFSPLMPAVGSSPLGQRSEQVVWVWQAWQPASPATDFKRSFCAASRTSLTSDQARLSAAGPRYSGRQVTVSHATQEKAMQDLQLIGVHEDGEHLLLASGDGGCTYRNRTIINF